MLRHNDSPAPPPYFTRHHPTLFTSEHHPIPLQSSSVSDPTFCSSATPTTTSFLSIIPATTTPVPPLPVARNVPAGLPCICLPITSDCTDKQCPSPIKKYEAEFSFYGIEEEDECGIESGTISHLALLSLRGHNTVSCFVNRRSLSSSSSLQRPGYTSEHLMLLRCIHPINSPGTHNVEAPIICCSSSQTLVETVKSDFQAKSGSGELLPTPYCLVPDSNPFSCKRTSSMSSCTGQTLLDSADKQSPNLKSQNNRMEEKSQWSDQAMHEGQKDEKEESAFEDNFLKEIYQIYIRILCGKSISLYVTGGETIGRLKKRIEAELKGMPVDCLIYEGKLLNDNKSLTDYGIYRNSIVQSSYRLPGGMKNWFARFKASEAATIEDTTTSTTGNESPPITLQELEKATENCTILSHNFSMVYRTRLRGKHIVIKKMVRGPGTVWKWVYDVVKNEARMLETCNHQYILGLKYFLESEAKDVCYVATELMNGSVYDHLHGERATEKLLTWGNRIDLLAYISDAVFYLHDGHDPPIYHGDLSSENILLDGFCFPRITEFGLARFASDDPDPILVGGNVLLTPGYRPSCYEPIGPASDIFAVGIIILELMTGKHPFEAGPSGLREWVQSRIEEDLSFIDRKLYGPDIDLRFQKRLLDLAMSCTHPDRYKRPNAFDVWYELFAIKRLYEDRMSI